MTSRFRRSLTATLSEQNVSDSMKRGFCSIGNHYLFSFMWTSPTRTRDFSSETWQQFPKLNHESRWNKIDINLERVDWMELEWKQEMLIRRKPVVSTISTIFTRVQWEPGSCEISRKFEAFYLLICLWELFWNYLNICKTCRSNAIKTRHVHVYVELKWWWATWVLL